MRFTEISESTTTAGLMSTVSMPLGKTQSRIQVAGLQPVQKVMGGAAKKKGPYGNSLTEGAMKQLSMDLKELKDEEFKKKYNMTKQEARKELSAKPEPIKEAELSEDDIILVPGQGRKMKTGFVPHGQSRVDHEVEMARSDLFSAAKNAKQVYEMIHSVSEDEGLEGWVQEKIIKANDYLNTVREYLEGKQIQQESGPMMYEERTEVKDKDGKVISWKDETEWHKTEKNKKGQQKDPRGVVTHLSDVARRKTEKQDTQEGKIDFAKKIQKNIDKSNKAVVKTNKEVGARVADIGAGGKEHNVKTDKAWDDAQKAKKAK
jgi:hypothetical protein